MPGADELPVPPLDDEVDGVVAVVPVGAAGVVEALSVDSFFVVDVDSVDSVPGGFILSE